jgi:hypothetical protein
MEQSPFSEANRSATTQEILRIMTPEDNYLSHTRSSPVHIPNYINSVHVSSSFFLNIHFNILPPSYLGRGIDSRWCQNFSLT